MKVILVTVTAGASDPTAAIHVVLNGNVGKATVKSLQNSYEGTIPRITICLFYSRTVL